MPPDLSVVIVNYNTRQLLLDCLASVYRSANGIALECIVVDNASSDGAVTAVRECFPHVRLIANPENRYFSAAYNQGVQGATGRYVVVINPDMVVQGHALPKLLRQIEADPTIGAATTTMFFPDGKLQRNGSRFVTFGYLVFRYTFFGKVLPQKLRAYDDWLWYADWDRTTQRDIDVLPGSCIIASKETWSKTRGFDARLPMYFSDDYLSRAVQALGKRTVYLVSDGIIHYEGYISKRMKGRTLNLYMHDLLVYTRLVFGRAAQIVLFILLIPTWLTLWLKRNRTD
jgi:GT2 family glycosyltransferase